MNPEHLLQHFERISEAPDAIPRLRRFILDLAVHGKLVEQDPNDEPAAELLKRIQADKERLVKEGKLRKSQPLAVLASKEAPFELPQHWEWLKLGSIGFTQTGTTPPTSKPECFGDFIPFVKPADLTRNAINYCGEGLSEIGIHYSRLIPRESVLMVCIGSSIGKVNITDRDVCCNQQINTVTPFLNGLTAFTSFSLRAAYFQELVLENAGMGTLPIISKGKWEQLPIPLPPLAEQHRIVAKVDELMALCDQLEAAKTEREQSRDRLVAASLHRLNSPADTAETDAPDLPAQQADAFRDHARFVFNHLPRLTTRTEHIKQLRQTILNLAVHGKLVRQDPNDEPASELLKRIQAEKARLIKVGTIPRQKLASNDSHELAFERPTNWEAINFSDVCNLVTSGSRGWAEFYSNTGSKFIRAQNIRFGRLQLDDLACVSLPEKAEGMRTQVSQGDLLVVITGAGVTNPAMLDLELGEAYVSQHVALIKPTTKNLSRWLLLCLMAPAGGRAELVERAYGAGKPGLNLDNIRSLRVPLPPLAEQHRIVARVDELMALCDQLEAQLTTTEADSYRLLEAVLHEALNPLSEVTEQLGGLRVDCNTAAALTGQRFVGYSV